MEPAKAGLPPADESGEKLRSESQQRERADVLELVVFGLSDILLILLMGIAGCLYMTAAHESIAISISANVQSIGVSPKQRKLRSTCVNSGRTACIPSMAELTPQ